jgi:hypothetical protein
MSVRGPNERKRLLTYVIPEFHLREFVSHTKVLTESPVPIARAKQDNDDAVEFNVGYVLHVLLTMQFTIAFITLTLSMTTSEGGFCLLLI